MLTSFSFTYSTNLHRLTIRVAYAIVGVRHVPQGDTNMQLSEQRAMTRKEADLYFASLEDSERVFQNYRDDHKRYERERQAEQRRQREVRGNE